jgi:PAS domain S-box-containing protein
LTNDPSFADVAEALSLGLPYRIRVSADGQGVRFLSVGTRCLEMTGVSPEEVLADAGVFTGLMLPPDRERIRAQSAVIFAARRPFSTEVRMRGPSGDERWRRLTVAPRPLPDGGTEWDGLMTDVTEAKRLAELLDEERRRLEQAFELTGMGVYNWDRDAPDVLEISDEQYAIYGVAPNVALSIETMLAMVHPDDRRLVREACESTYDRPDGGDSVFEHRIIRPDGKVRWVVEHQRIRRDGRGLKSIYGVMLDITERRNAEEQRRLQMRELAHRGRNALTLLMAMIHQAARRAATVEELVEVLMARIEAMAKSQELATAWDGRPLPLATLVRQSLGIFDLTRFDLDPELETLTAPGEAVVGVALLLHELATNAVKYGALSNQDGRVALTQGREAGGRLVVTWREVGGPPVETPVRQGFGARLLVAVLQGVGGCVTPIFAPDGFSARIELPAA